MCDKLTDKKVEIVSLNGKSFHLQNESQDNTHLSKLTNDESFIVIEPIHTGQFLNNPKFEEIKKSIEKITKRVVRLESENDPNIIAGIELKVGSFLFNSSINSKLESMKNILKRG